MCEKAATQDLRLQLMMGSVTPPNVDVLEQDTTPEHLPEGPLSGESQARLYMLNFVVKTSGEIWAKVKDGESGKETLRKWIFYPQVVLLCAVIVFLCAIITLDLLGVVTLNGHNLAVLVLYVIFQLASIIVTIIKFATDVKYIEMFKEVSQKLLEYLIEDKKHSK